MEAIFNKHRLLVGRAQEVGLSLALVEFDITAWFFHSGWTSSYTLSHTDTSNERPLRVDEV